MYKHPEDRRSQRRAYYRAHKQKIKDQAAVWYQEHKEDPDYKKRRRDYMRAYRWKRKIGA